MKNLSRFDKYLDGTQPLVKPHTANHKPMVHKQMRNCCKSYEVEITETPQRTITVLAKTPEEAYSIVKRDYVDGQHILDSEDFIDYDISLLNEPIKARLNNGKMEASMENVTKKTIRFIDPDYNTKFTISDGEMIEIRHSDGYTLIRPCKYIDDYHVSVDGNCYHICEFAEKTQEAGTEVKAAGKAEINCGYRIITWQPDGNRIFVIGENVNAPDPYVTWATHKDFSGEYEWGHYFKDKISAQSDLIRRVKNEQTFQKTSAKKSTKKKTEPER